MTTKPIFFIGIPTVDGRVNAELMLTLIKWSQPHANYSIIVSYQPFTIPHDHARNVLVKKFLESKATHFIGIDDDVIPPLDAISKFYTMVDKDFVSGIVNRAVAHKDGIDITPAVFDFNGETFETKYNYQPEKKLKRIAGCGLGFYMAKREIFEKITRPFEFKYTDDGIIKTSEDLAFCLKMKESKFEMWADYSIACKHIKEIDISLLK
jgi:hypothetical protein